MTCFISRLDFRGTYMSYMHLNGFGHGVSCGVRPSGDHSCLWIGCEANKHGYGTTLACITYPPGA